MKEHVIHEIMSIPIHAVTMKEAVAYAEILADEEKNEYHSHSQCRNDYACPKR